MLIWPKTLLLISFSISHFFFLLLFFSYRILFREMSLFGFILCVNIPTPAREREHSRISSRVRTHPNSISMYHCGVVSLCSRRVLGSLMCAILGAFHCSFRSWTLKTLSRVKRPDTPPPRSRRCGDMCKITTVYFRVKRWTQAKERKWRWSNWITDVTAKQLRRLGL